MLGLFSRLAQRREVPLPTREARPSTTAEETTEAALALARELLHSIEQFVISTPDLDTTRFLHRMRGTAAGLTPKADAHTIRLHQQWVRKALSTFGALQHRYVAEREEEMWRLIECCSKSSDVGQTRSTELTTALRQSHQRLREMTSLDDLRSARERIEEELIQAQRLVEMKAREDRDRIAALTRQVTRLEAALAAVRGQADYDVLTGVFHRGVLQDKLSALLSGGKPCALALMDVDNFKTINDTLGHLVGDKLLAMIGEQLQRVARSSDLVARFGGDEFCFVAVGFTAEQLAQRLSGAVARRHLRMEMDERMIGVLLSLSTGIAASLPGEAPEALLNRADMAMLAAKRTGKGGMRLASLGSGEGSEYNF